MESVRTKRRASLTLEGLPAALLTRLGTYLRPVECFNIVRCCKSNEGLRPILASITKANVGVTVRSPLLAADPLMMMYLRHHIVRAQLASLLLCPNLKIITGRDVPLVLLQPLLTSQPSLKSLELTCETNKDVEVLTQVLLWLPGLETFNIFFWGLGLPLPCEPLMSSLLGRIPGTLRSLALDELGSEMVKSLSAILLNNKLPLLEELFLPYLGVGKKEDLECLSLAFSSPAGQKLKTLGLHVSEDHSDNASGLLGHVLGLDAGEMVDGYLSRLSTLLVGKVDWNALGQRLVGGKFKKLVEVRRLGTDDIVPKHFDPEYLPNWYEVDPPTTNLWLKLLRTRPLKGFDDGIRFFSEGQGMPSVVLVSNLLGSLSQPVHAKMTSYIKYMDLTSLDLDNELCITLAGAIRSKYFCSLDSLMFLFHHACDVTGYIALGKVLNHEYVSRLKLISLGVGTDPVGAPRVTCWRAFFEAIPPEGLNKLESLWVVGSDTQGAEASIFNALHSISDPTILKSVTSLNVYGYLTVKDIIDMATALITGSFPNLDSMCIKDRCYIESPEGVATVHLFLHALSANTKLKQISFDKFSQKTHQLYFQQMDLLLGFFAQSPTIFPFLETISFRHSDQSVQPGIVERCNRARRIRRPLNLKWVWFNGEKLPTSSTF